MTAPIDYGRFFLPGPTEVRPEILEAMVRPIIGHRGKDMEELLSGMDVALRALFRTDRPVYVSTSSATGFMEAAITNLSRCRMLCLVGGAFGARFHKIADVCGRPADVLAAEWGTPHTPEMLGEALMAEPGKYDLVTVVHSETSTGVLNPVADLAAVVRDHEDVLIAVDGVTSVGGVRVEFDDWDLDLLEFERRAGGFQTTNTPAVSLFYALEVQLERIREEGLENRWDRHSRMAERTWDWVADLADRTGKPFSVLAPEGYRSPTVTSISLPAGLSGPGIVGAAVERGYTLAAGYGKLKPSTIRIGHMGDHTLAELEAILSVLDVVIDEQLTQRDVI